MPLNNLNKYIITEPITNVISYFVKMQIIHNNMFTNYNYLTLINNISTTIHYEYR